MESLEQEGNMKRDNSFDLLRCICTAAVIIVHTSAFYLQGYYEPCFGGNYYKDNFASTCFYNCLPRFSVPCFLMLSGAFLLSDKRNCDYKYFYKKYLRKTGIQTAVFSVFYFIGKLTFFCISGNLGLESLKDAVFSFFSGIPYYHLWYLYVLIGIYVIAPFILQIKESIGEKAFRLAAVLYLPLACISYLTGSYSLYYDVGLVAEYTALFLMGYVLKSVFTKKNNMQGILCIVGGEALLCCLAEMQRKMISEGLGDIDMATALREPLTPLVISASLLTFIGFAKLEIHFSIGKLVNLLFYVYLFHAGILSVLLELIIARHGASWDSRLVIPLMSVVVLILSVMASKCYLVITGILQSRWEKYRASKNAEEG